MPLTTEFDQALNRLLDAWRDHHDLKLAGASIDRLADALGDLETARTSVIAARRSLAA